MSQSLWVECKTNNKTSKSKVFTEGCNDVDDFIRKIRNEPQFSSIKNSEITLYGPSGTAISVGDPISSLLPGNSSKNPLHVQVSAGTDPASTAMLTLFWNSLRKISEEERLLHFNTIPHFSRTVSRHFMFERLMRICSRLFARIIRPMLPRNNFAAWP